MHISVLKDELINNLNLKEDSIIVDGTLGYAGDSSIILERIKKGFLFAFDQDSEAIEYSTNVLNKIGTNFTIIKSNFVNLKQELNKRGIEKIDGAIFDLGVSSPQLDNGRRGFSYHEDARLDMRMDKDNPLDAYYVVNNYRNSGIESLNESIFKGATFQKLYIIVLLIIFIPLTALALFYLIIKHKNKKKKVKKIDRHKYTDMLTSLKNRNYLNAKMSEWEDCNVYPQAIVMVDLNNVKYVNDNYGHSEGDNLIIKAAALLVNTQLENSEIIRTDGNEFLIYLIGYSERQISTYCKKLTKEMKNLPHEFGAAIGFSMIEDSIKTLDDAINEATLDMINAKEDFK